jgi:hypothetical protein
VSLTLCWGLQGGSHRRLGTVLCDLAELSSLAKSHILEGCGQKIGKARS